MAARLRAASCEHALAGETRSLIARLPPVSRIHRRREGMGASPPGTHSMPFPRPVVYSGGPTVALATGGVLSGAHARLAPAPRTACPTGYRRKTPGARHHRYFSICNASCAAQLSARLAYFVEGHKRQLMTDMAEEHGTGTRGADGAPTPLSAELAISRTSRTLRGYHVCCATFPAASLPAEVYRSPEPHGRHRKRGAVNARDESTLSRPRREECAYCAKVCISLPCVCLGSAGVVDLRAAVRLSPPVC